MENSTVINLMDYTQNKEENKCTALVPYVSSISENQTADAQTESTVSETTETTATETVVEITLETEDEATAEVKAEEKPETAEDETEDEEDDEKTEKKTKKKAPVFLKDDFAEINKQNLSEEDKAKLYMINHFHIQPELLNSILNGDFSTAWKSITDMNKVNLSVKKKLEKELKGADDSRLMIVQFLIDKATKEPEFANKVLLEHKSFDRCFNYILEKVKILYTGKNGNCIQADEDWTYQQAVDYYELDDYDQIMEERRKAEERKKKAEEARKKATEKKKTTKSASKKDTSDTSKSTATEKTTETKTEEKVEDKNEAKVEANADNKAEPTENTLENVSATADSSDATSDVLTTDIIAGNEIDNSVVDIDTTFEDKTANEPEYKMTTNEFGQLSFLF